LTNTINAVKQSFNGINAQPSINGSKTDGSGQVIAILDTGVEERHPALGSSKVLQGACFSTGSNGGNSLCTNHQSSNKLSLTAGRSCAETWVGGRASAIAAGCGHGTAMAAAAAFSYVSSDKVTINAIAPAAQILPIQVFNQNGMSLSANGGDLLAALEWLASEAQRRRKNDLAPIVSVNLSLGGGSYTNSCDNEFVASLFKNAFAKLRTEGVLPIVATGNAGLKNAISFPACVSNSVSVSAAQLGYGNLANYANINNQTRLIAIGGDVNGRYALPVLCPSEGIFDCWQALAGTSPATAFVSGGVAALYSAKPTATLAEIESALTSNTNSATALTLTAGNPVVNRPALRLTSSTYRLLNLQEPNPVAEMVSAPAPLPAPRPTPAPAPPAVAVQQVQICLFSNTNYTGAKSCTMQDYGGSGVGRNIFYSFFGRVGSVRISTTNAVPLSGVASVTLYNAVSPRGTSSGTIDSSSLNTTRLTGPNNPIIRLVQIKTSKP
jgi:subtilisin family serine protease